MKLKALLEKRGALVRELEAFANLDSPDEAQVTRSKAAIAELDGVKAQIEDAEKLARAIADGQAPVNMPPAPGQTKRDSGDNGRVEIVSRLISPRAFTPSRFGSKQAAEKQAVRCGMALAAGLFKSERALRFCREQGIQVRTTANVENLNGDGGYLVDTETDAEIIRLVEEYGVARRFCRIQPMNSNAFDKKKLKTGATAAFVNEAGTLTASKLAFQNVKLVAKKAYTLIPFSAELSEDSAANLADEIVMDSALAFASLEDNALFNGNADAAYGGIKGILNAVGAGATKAQTSITTFATCTDAFLMAALAALPGRARNRVWFAHPEVCEAVFNRLSRTAGGITRAEMLGGGPVTYYAGYPVIPTEAMPHAGTSGTAYAVVGDLSQAVLFGDRRGITMQRLVERYADEDLEAIKCTERFDINVHDVGTSTVAGAVVRCNLG